MDKINSINFIILLFCFICFAIRIPEDNRTWKQVVNDFKQKPAKQANDGYDDGKRLILLNPNRAKRFLIRYLNQKHPYQLRLKAIGALGWNSVKEAIPKISNIALDEKEKEVLRIAALNPGLRYMNDSIAIETAILLVNNANPNLRFSSYWVLSKHGNDKALLYLKDALKKEKGNKKKVLYPFFYSENIKAGEIVYENCHFEEIKENEKALQAYSYIMSKYKVKEAKSKMYSLTRHENSIVASNALIFFGNSPENKIVSLIVDFVNRGTSLNSKLYNTICVFLESENINELNKKKLKNLIDTGKTFKLKIEY